MTYVDILKKHIGSKCRVVSEEGHSWCKIVIGEKKRDFFTIEDVSDDYVVVKEYGQEFYDTFLLSNISVRFFGIKPFMEKEDIVKQDINAEKIHINIKCIDDSFIDGFINILPEQKLTNIINNPNEIFIIVNDAKVHYKKPVESFVLSSTEIEQQDSLILNKHEVKWITEIK